MKPQEIAATLPKILTTSRTPFIWGDPGIGKSDVMAFDFGSFLVALLGAVVLLGVLKLIRK